MVDEEEQATDTYLFLDTNVFLHYDVFGGRDWRVLAGVMPVAVCVTCTVFAELDKHKHASDRRLKSRASNVVHKLVQIEDSGGGVAGGTRLILLDSVLSQGGPQVAGPSVSSGDDRILAEIAAWKEQHPDRRAVLVTEDGYPRIRAPRLGIETAPPPDDWKLPDEPDPFEAENRELRDRLREIESRAPRLELRFGTGGSANGVIEAEVTAPEYLDHEELEAEVARMVAAAFGPPPDVRASRFIIPSAVGATLQAMRGKEESKPEYAARVRAYLQGLHEYNDAVARTLTIPAALHNSGSAPAKDIAVRLTLTGQPYFLPGRDLPNQPERPRRLTGLTLFDSLYSGQGSAQAIRSQYAPNVSDLFVDGQLARSHVHTLGHRSSVELGTLHVQFLAYEAVRSFSINYEVLVSEPPDTIEKTVHVKVTKSGVSSGDG